ncbi:unnamed protein product [Closterium sp. NIES-54]
MWVDSPLVLSMNIMVLSTRTSYPSMPPCLHQSIHSSSSPHASPISLTAHIPPRVPHTNTVPWLQAKVANLGVVRVGESSVVNFTDPCYAQTMQASSACDLYSFGLVILVTVASHAALLEEEFQSNTLQSVTNCLSSGDVVSLKDPRMDAPDDMFARLIQLALSCCLANASLRPAMPLVVKELKDLRGELLGTGSVNGGTNSDIQQRLGGIQQHEGFPRAVIAQTIEPSQAAVLAECQRQWGATFPGWTAGGKCADAFALVCDSDGMIVKMEVEKYGTDGASLGSIPHVLSNLSRLSVLSLSVNAMTGPIPPSLANLPKLNALSLYSNNLTGSIPSTFSRLKLLVYMDLSNNLLSGRIPSQLSSLGRLTHLDIGYNSLTGTIPASLGSLLTLQYLFLNDNQLIDSLPPSLSTLSKLKVLALQDNHLSGNIPESLANLNQLSALLLSGNTLEGSIPSSFGRLSKLTSLGLSGNELIGPIPSNLASLTALNYLSLSNNGLSDGVPTFIGNLTSLIYLYLSNNQLQGSLPPSIWALPALIELDLSDNMLTGSIPSSITSLDGLSSLNLAGNSITGSIPDALGNLTTLTLLDLSNTQLGSSMPSSLGGLTQLVYLEVQNSQLKGSLPATLGAITSLTALDINGTGLTCPAPGTSCIVPQNRSSTFCSVCRAFCSGCIPPSPSPPPSPPAPPVDSPPPASQPGLPTGAIIGIAVAGGLLLLALAAAALWIWHTRNREVPHKQHKQASRLIRKYSLVPPMCQQFSLEDMEQATNNWAKANLLGSGGFGDVFKGVSPLDGTTLWAVKRAKLLTNDFDREVTQMATKHHPNLVRLLGFCIDVEPETAHVEQILVYEFVPNGDLEKRMAPDAATPLTLQQRLEILLGAAHGLEYLHSFNMVHRDIKPANILIDANMQIGRNEAAALKDPRMDASEEIIMRITQLAVHCTAKRTANRPSMTDIATELQTILVALGGPTSRVFRAAEQVDAQLDVANSNRMDLDEAFSIIDSMNEHAREMKNPKDV